MMKGLSVIVALAWLVCVASAATYYSQAYGRVLCRVANNLYPIKEVTVMLMDKDILKDDRFGRTISDRNGYFSTPQGSVREFFSKPDPYIKVCYQYNGIYGQMEVNGLLKTIRDDRSRTKPYNSYINFRDIVFSGDNCRAYVKFYNSLEDYYNKTNEAFPIRPLHIRTKTILSWSTPYTKDDTISLSQGYQLTMTTAKTLLAHILRHSLDGDTARFSYRNSLQCDATTSPERAFDEGWGRYWAGGCTDSDFTGFFRYNQLDYSVVRNVAAGLRRIQMRCSFTYRQMINVLRRNPRSIRRFEEFERASRCPEVPPTTGPVSTPYTTPGPTRPPPATTIPWSFRPIMPTRRPMPTRHPTRRPPGIVGYRGEVQEDREKKEMIQTLLKLLESK